MCYMHGGYAFDNALNGGEPITLFELYSSLARTHWSASLFDNAVGVFLDALPFLALGFFIAGLFKSFLPQQWVVKTLGGESSWFMSPVKGAVLGAPIPLCSCSVIPVVTELKKQGANKGSLTAFLVSAPETGADSLSLSYALLGPVMAIARLVSALVTAMATAWAVMLATGKKMPIFEEETPPETPKKTNSSCCAKSSNNTTTAPKPEHPKQSLLGQFIMGQRYAFTKLLDDTMGYMVLALAFTAVMKTFVPITFLGQYSYGLLPMVLTVLVAFPMYVCASMATPISAWLILSGISPGVALVFMLAGPASNIATVAAVHAMMGLKSAVVYVLSVSTLSIGAGLTLNALLDIYNWDLLVQAGQGTILNPTIAIASSIFLVLCAIKPLRKYIGLA